MQCMTDMKKLDSGVESSQVTSLGTVPEAGSRNPIDERIESIEVMLVKREDTRLVLLHAACGECLFMVYV